MKYLCKNKNQIKSFLSKCNWDLFQIKLLVFIFHSSTIIKLKSNCFSETWQSTSKARLRLDWLWATLMTDNKSRAQVAVTGHAFGCARNTMAKHGQAINVKVNMPYRAVKCKGYYNKINNAKFSTAKIKSNINNLWRAQQARQQLYIASNQPAKPRHPKSAITTTWPR